MIYCAAEQDQRQQQQNEHVNVKETSWQKLENPPPPRLQGTACPRNAKDK